MLSPGTHLNTASEAVPKIDEIPLYKRFYATLIRQDGPLVSPLSATAVSAPRISLVLLYRVGIHSSRPTRSRARSLAGLLPGIIENVILPSLAKCAFGKRQIWTLVLQRSFRHDSSETGAVTHGWMQSNRYKYNCAPAGFLLVILHRNQKCSHSRRVCFAGLGLSPSFSKRLRRIGMARLHGPKESLQIPSLQMDGTPPIPASKAPTPNIRPFLVAAMEATQVRMLQASSAAQPRTSTYASCLSAHRLFKVSHHRTATAFASCYVSSCDGRGGKSTWLELRTMEP